MDLWLYDRVMHGEIVWHDERSDPRASRRNQRTYDVSWHQNAVYAMVQPVPLPLPSESMGVEGSVSGSEKMAGMEKNEVKESIEVRE